jgi:hypothetical protein
LPKLNSKLLELQAELQQTPTSYAEAKIQSGRLDEMFGFECEKIEDELFETEKEHLFSSPRQFWYGLEVQSMQTPYSELLEFVHFLKPKPQDLWLDLGAAYGRMGLVLACFAPEVRFIGYEFVQSRVDEGNRVFRALGVRQAQLVSADLAAADLELPDADLFFVYDFGSKDDVYKVLEKLRVKALAKPIQVIARGRGIRNWILMDFPWLYDVKPPQHFKTWSYFQS